MRYHGYITPFVGVSLLIVVLLIGVVVVMTVTTAGEELPVVQTVNFQELINYLPQPPTGWDAAEPEGGSFSYDGGTVSQALRNYVKLGGGDITAEVIIIDSAFNKVSAWATWQGFYAYQSAEGYAKKVAIKGYPAWESYTKSSEEYSFFVGINDRYFVFIHTNSDSDSLYEFVDAIDYPGIAALGGGVVPAAATPELPPPTASTSATPAEPGGETPGFQLVLTVTGLLVVFALLKRHG
jgi:hypothetical protein